MPIADRTLLRGYFATNKIPTADHFGQLIDAGLNQAEDGISKVVGQPLTIRADTDADALRLFAGPETARYWQFKVTDSGSTSNLSLGEQGVHVLYIQGQTQNVGLGVPSPTAKLDVNGTVKATSLSISSNAVVTGNLGVGVANPTVKLDVLGDIKATNLNLTTRLGIALPGAPTVALDVNGDIKARVLTLSSHAYVTGNMGVGTLSPTQKLDVSGNAIVSGNMGVGTASPSVRLDVAGDIKATNLNLTNRLGIGLPGSPTVALDVNGDIKATNLTVSGSVSLGKTAALGGSAYHGPSGLYAIDATYPDNVVRSSTMFRAAGDFHNFQLAVPNINPGPQSALWFRHTHSDGGILSTGWRQLALQDNVPRILMGTVGGGAIGFNSPAWPLSAGNGVRAYQYAVVFSTAFTNTPTVYIAFRHFEVTSAVSNLEIRAISVTPNGFTAEFVADGSCTSPAATATWIALGT